MVTNRELKLRARSALKNNWQTALMVCLIASLPSLIAQVVTLMNQGGYTQAVDDMMAIIQDNAAMSDPMAAADMMYATMDSLMPITMSNMVSLFLSPFLTLGMLRYFFRLLRGDADVPVSEVFSCRRSFFKAIGLTALVALRTLLWMLPGMGVSLVGTVLYVLLPEGVAVLGDLLATAGLIAMLVLGIRMAFHLSMADRVMAEDPAKGVKQCMRESIDMMRTRKMRLFLLLISFILYMIVLVVLEVLLEPLVGGVVTTTLSMTLDFVLNIYLQMTISAFYLANRQQTEN